MFTPYGKYVVIEVEPLKEKTDGGIILPQQDLDFKECFVFGTVKSVGSGRRSPKTGQRLDVEVKPGDRVIFNDHVFSHDSFHVLEEKPRTIVCEEDNIFAVVSE